MLCVRTAVSRVLAAPPGADESSSSDEDGVVAARDDAAPGVQVSGYGYIDDAPALC